MRGGRLWKVFIPSGLLKQVLRDVWNLWVSSLRAASAEDVPGGGGGPGGNVG